VARFGFFSISAPLANIEDWAIEPPYRWWRSVGVRGTLFKPEMTFGGSAHGGIRVTLRRRQSLRWWPWGLERLYLTLDDPAALGAELGRHGIPQRVSGATSGAG
jgi:hypothetical protein